MSPDDFDSLALRILREAIGPDATFRDQQLESIRNVAYSKSRSLVVQRTGWGKSVVYFVATRLLRDAGAGPTLIISPLLALMRDQIDAAERVGLRAVTINSSNIGDWDAIEATLLDGSVDILLISPERLNNPDFRDRLLGPLTQSAGLLVVDEAHCISDWGHDFRPDYRRLARILELMPSNVPVLCTTATANNRVIEDIVEQLGAELAIIRGSLDRVSLSLNVIALNSQAERLAWLAQTVPELSGSGIVYCLTVADTQRVADWLNTKSIPSIAYSGDTDAEERPGIERKLKTNAVKVVAATSALGMGFDKPDLSFVIHFQSPDSPVAYYQQVGRAGRAIEAAHVVLLVGQEDSDIWTYFLETSLPLQAHAELVVEHLQSLADWVPLSQLEALCNLPSSRLTGLLKILEVDGAVEKSGTRFRRTLRPWAFDSERVERVREARVAEQQAMRDYAMLTSCRMAYLRRSLDDEGSENCGRCDNCINTTSNVSPNQALLVEAAEFIRNRPVNIEPRKQWAGGHKTGRFPPAEQLQPGRALSLLSDPGWGRELLDCKRTYRPVSDALVVASANLIRGWLPDLPEHVVFTPAFDSRRNLVPDFARRLAAELGISLSTCLIKTRQTQPQKLMENSAQQVRNVDAAFGLGEDPPAGPVLLVDDICGSRWTMTTLGVLLGSAGAGPIYPFAIAKTRG